MFAIVILSDWAFNFQRLGLSIILLAALSILYTALTARSHGRARSFAALDFEAAIIPLSQKVTIILGASLVLQLVAFGVSSDAILPAILLGVLKASSWYFTARTVRYSWFDLEIHLLTYFVDSIYHFLAFSHYDDNFQYNVHA